MKFPTKRGEEFVYLEILPDLTISWETIICSSISHDVAYLRFKIQGFTWVKKSKKNGHWGWVCPFPPLARLKWVKSFKPPVGIGRTKLQSLRSIKSDLSRIPKDWQEENHDEMVKKINSLERRYKK